MYDLTRIAYVTRHYEALKGLTYLPVALWLLGWAAYDVGWIERPMWIPFDWLFGMLSTIVMLLSLELISRLYDRWFGWVSTGDKHKQKRSGRENAAYLGAYVSLSMFRTLRSDVSEPGLLIVGAVLWAFWFRLGTNWLAALGAVIGAMSVAPLLDGVLGPVYPSPTARDVSIKVVAAVGFLLVGTLNHLTLVRTLGPVRREEEESSA
ncbi:MAG: hypothetical protein M3P51_07575 [Chloroflexota bacterium]|nr:hypothetical protein [Chloroflexota bacterium]